VCARVSTHCCRPDKPSRGQEERRGKGFKIGIRLTLICVVHTIRRGNAMGTGSSCPFVRVTTDRHSPYVTRAEHPLTTPSPLSFPPPFRLAPSTAACSFSSLAPIVTLSPASPPSYLRVSPLRLLPRWLRLMLLQPLCPPCSVPPFPPRLQPQRQQCLRPSRRRLHRHRHHRPPSSRLRSPRLVLPRRPPPSPRRASLSRCSTPLLPLPLPQPSVRSPMGPPLLPAPARPRQPSPWQHLCRGHIRSSPP